jgi:hypothetical protein
MDCYDNAYAESFFHSLKVESIHGERFVTRAARKQTVFGYIEVDYNRTPRHSFNGFISPEVFEAQKVAQRDVHCSRAGSISQFWCQWITDSRLRPHTPAGLKIATLG